MEKHWKALFEQDLFHGSEVIEAGREAVIGQRLKESGMFWSESGATNIPPLRCALQSNRWDECRDRLHDPNRLKIRPAV